MEKPAQNIQDSFLNNARKDKIVLTIYLMSGVKLSGRIKSFDKYSLVLETNNQEQLIFKHAISTVVTQKSSHSYNVEFAGGRAGDSGASAPGVPVHSELGGLGNGHCNPPTRERAILVGLDWKTRGTPGRVSARPGGGIARRTRRTGDQRRRRGRRPRHSGPHARPKRPR